VMVLLSEFPLLWFSLVDGCIDAGNRLFLVIK